MLNRGRHLCSAGRPSGWALAHILVTLNIEIAKHDSDDIFGTTWSKKRSPLIVEGLRAAPCHLKIFLIQSLSFMTFSITTTCPEKHGATIVLPLTLQMPNDFTERELTFTFAICCRLCPSVCRLSSVCNARAPYSAS